jgi:hypothetical protein
MSITVTVAEEELQLCPPIMYTPKAAFSNKFYQSKADWSLPALLARSTMLACIFRASSTALVLAEFIPTGN